MQLGLPPPEPLDFSGGNISVNRQKFKQKNTNKREGQCTQGSNISTVTGNDAIGVFNTVTWDEEGEDKKIDKVLLEFKEHCETNKNVSYER